MTRALWDTRAALGERAGTDDVIAAALERRAIASYVWPGALVCEVGCGTGELARRVARKAARVRAFDASAWMVAMAREATSPALDCRFFQVDVRNGWRPIQPVDIWTTQRVIINLPTFYEQLAVIVRLATSLKPGGLYLMCENVVEGLTRMNRLREWWNLPAIIPPAHNRYLSEAEIASIPRHAPLDLVAMRYPCSTYALVSRLVNAKLAQRRGEEPRYDAWPNRIARWLPSLGTLGQNRLYVWRRRA